jgi:glutamine amidotransferase
MSILLINSEVSNIGSWKRILHENNFDFMLSNELNINFNAVKKIIFPGVGNFGKVINNVKRSNLNKIIPDLLKNKDIKYLGVCVGMQILLDYSEECESEGLGLISGNVKKLNFKDFPSTHNGWNNISIINNNSKIIKKIDQNKDFYFNHSYFCKVKNRKNIVSTLKNNDEISTIIQKENIYGVQFHPEKSHEAGIDLIKNFLSA